MLRLKYFPVFWSKYPQRGHLHSYSSKNRDTHKKQSYWNWDYWSIIISHVKIMIRCVKESIRTVWWVQKIVLLWWVCKIKVKDDTHRLGRHAAFKCTSCKGHPSGHKSQNKLHSRRCWKEVKSPIEWWFRALWHQHNLNYLIKERVKVSRSS